MRKTLALLSLVLLLAVPAFAQTELNGNVSSTEQTVRDSIGVGTAISLGTTSATIKDPTVDGTLTTDGFDAVLNSDIILCGDLANNGTIYFGPGLGELDGTQTGLEIAGTACSALDNATEATADAPIGFANNAFKVYGMLCEVTGSGSNGVTLTARSGAADLSTSLTCTIATTQTSCAAVLDGAVTIAANATIAIKAVDTEDLSAQDGWCKLFIGIVP